MNRPPALSWRAYKAGTRYLAQGSSTSSKVPTLEGAEPAQIVRGKGCRVWDVDGNEYIDFRNALGPITLGYAIPEINAAIAAQLENGIIFGHPHPLEAEVAEHIVDVVPCAERVRFLKTGGEAVAACIKIARHATKRNTILHCGYNGWLNALSLGGFRPVGMAAAEPQCGVPQAVASLHRALPWANEAAWRAAFAEEGAEVAAAVIACNYVDMEKGAEFLPALRALTREHGALLIIDEIVTGFRLAIGGAHAHFDLVPDLAVFSKGMANGMPISAYVGSGELIDSARDLGISSTFGGETLSLAACRAVLRFYNEHDVIAHLWRVGRRLRDGMNALFAERGIAARLAGFPVCAYLEAEPEIVERVFRAAYRHGVSLYNVLYVNYSHQDADIDEALDRLGEALTAM